MVLATAGVRVAIGETKPPRSSSVMPPGAGAFGRFRRSCLACGLCVSACPSRVLVPAGVLAYGLSGTKMPRLDFTRGACDPACARCAEVCPAGALTRYRPAERARQRIGLAEWSRALFRTSQGEACSLCRARCPKNAIRWEKDEGAAVPHPVVVTEACIGCGGCENSCPATPKAIRVRAVDPQEFAFGADTFVAYLTDGTAWTSQARGVKPLLDALDGAAVRFAGARCYDRIVGRAAAFLYAKIGVGEVFAPVISTGALAILRRHGIVAHAAEEIPFIRNRKGDGICPMDASVQDLGDDQRDAAEAAIRKTVATLSRQ
ncbi:MAG: DUF1893 domain-containing protein [Kiritimatiellia bacterium]